MYVLYVHTYFTKNQKNSSPTQFYNHKFFFRVLENLKETVAAQNPPVRIELEGFQYMYRLWRYWMTKEPADFPYLLGNMQSRVNGIVELFKKASISTVKN